MNETFLKSFLRLGINIALRIPLRLLGVWLLSQGYVESAEWELFAAGAAVCSVDLVWWYFERRGVLKAFAQKDAIINQQQSRILDHLAELDRRKELVEIALDLPKGATVQDALAIQEKQGLDPMGTV